MLGTARTRSRTSTSPSPVDGGADVRALTRLVAAAGRASDVAQVVQAVVAVLHDELGWSAATAWTIDPDTRVLAPAAQAGGAGFTRLAHTVGPEENAGLTGHARQARGLVVLDDLQASDCPRVAAARADGARQALALPLIVEREVVAYVDAYATVPQELTPQRRDVLTALGTIASQALARVVVDDRHDETTRDATARTAVLHAVAKAPTAQHALSAALDTIRREFGWVYGSYWAIDATEGVLRFVQESGDAGAEFRRVTRTATFARGVGLAGRTWQSGELVFVPDLAEVTDCVRAPAARAAGVRSGVCLPIVVDGQVVGTMDFFVLDYIELSDGRRKALQDTAFLVGQALSRFTAAERLQTAGRELITSIEEVERNVVSATAVAGDGQRLVLAADEDVAALGRASEKIGQVVQTIDTVAAQTHLLALNASIEAARAGAAGRGFAVVANEVKELANETARATTEVTEKVVDIQRQVTATVAALAGVREVVEQINGTQQVISAVLTQQAAVVRSILD